METATPLLSTENDSLVVCQNAEGVEIQATLLRLSRQKITFELYGAAAVLRLSELLTDLRIFVGGQVAYSGRAVVASVVNVGSVLVCEAHLEDSWLDLDLRSLADRSGLNRQFATFLERWQKSCQVRPEFKVVVADIQTFLLEMRLWLEQIELGIRSSPTGERQLAEARVVRDLEKQVASCLNPLFQRFESIACDLEVNAQPAHSSFAKRQLHSLLLCSPFMYRIFRKPLGYAGDYEMVRMILRDPQEGSSLFAKVLNAWFLGQVPAEAHRNRVKYLTQKLIEETLWLRNLGATAKVFNLGCGPAGEVQEFLAHPLADHAEFALLDFNDETLGYTGSVLEELKRKHHRNTRVQLIKKSVGQLLKSGARRTGGGADNTHNFIYCAGLFDYLPDRICKQLMNMFYDMLAPGGLLIATNVDPSNPIRWIMDFIFEWHLVYRSNTELGLLAPDAAPADSRRIVADMTGSNIFIEVRKPFSDA